MCLLLDHVRDVHGRAVDRERHLGRPPVTRKVGREAVKRIGKGGDLAGPLRARQARAVEKHDRRSSVDLRAGRSRR